MVVTVGLVVAVEKFEEETEAVAEPDGLTDTDVDNELEPVVETVAELEGNAVIVEKFDGDTVPVTEPLVLAETDVDNEFDEVAVLVPA